MLCLESGEHGGQEKSFTFVVFLYVRSVCDARKISTICIRTTTDLEREITNSVPISTLVRFEQLCCHGYNDEHVVKVMEWSQLKETKSEDWDDWINCFILWNRPVLTFLHFFHITILQMHLSHNLSKCLTNTGNVTLKKRSIWSDTSPRCDGCVNVSINIGWKSENLSLST